MIVFTGLAFLKNDNIIWEDVTNKINLCVLIISRGRQCAFIFNFGQRGG